jgi:hypothetical protein
MEMALVIAQTERLDRLNESIQKLAVAIGERPTKKEIEHARIRSRNKSIVVGVIVAALIGWLYLQNAKIKQSCEDRNANSIKFRSVLTLLLSPDPDRPNGTNKPTKHDVAVGRALQEYTNGLTKIEC